MFKSLRRSLTGFFWAESLLQKQPPGRTRRQSRTCCTLACAWTQRVVGPLQGDHLGQFKHQLYQLGTDPLAYSRQRLEASFPWSLFRPVSFFLDRMFPANPFLPCKHRTCGWRASCLSGTAASPGTLKARWSEGSAGPVLRWLIRGFPSKTGCTKGCFSARAAGRSMAFSTFSLFFFKTMLIDLR